MNSLENILGMIATEAIEGEEEKVYPGPYDCDCCSNTFLSHNIEWCPECDISYCDACEETQHHCYDDDGADNGW